MLRVVDWENNENASKKEKREKMCRYRGRKKL